MWPVLQHLRLQCSPPTTTMSREFNVTRANRIGHQSIAFMLQLYANYIPGLKTGIADILHEIENMPLSETRDFEVKSESREHVFRQSFLRLKLTKYMQARDNKVLFDYVLVSGVIVSRQLSITQHVAQSIRKTLTGATLCTILCYTTITSLFTNMLPKLFSHF